MTSVLCISPGICCSARRTATAAWTAHIYRTCTTCTTATQVGVLFVVELTPLYIFALFNLTFRA